MPEDAPATPPAYRLHRSLGYKLSLASRLQERRLDEGLRRLGLTRVTWCVLLAVGVERLDRPSDIARFVGIDRTATSRALRQMEADGLVTRESGEGDRRTTKVTATARGRALLAAAAPLAEANNAVMESKLSAEECATLHRLLERLLEGEDLALNRL
ncbi:MAG: MarR family transcriptional regulator [Alphaproteobacteria bacterium]|nr:MAG: MarR family transcriptional regulator [Alphaproteobacteria bacterium]